MCISIVNIILTINKNGTTLDRISDFAVAAITPPLASFVPSFQRSFYTFPTATNRPSLPLSVSPSRMGRDLPLPGAADMTEQTATPLSVCGAICLS